MSSLQIELMEQVEIKKMKASYFVKTLMLSIFGFFLIFYCFDLFTPSISKKCRALKISTPFEEIVKSWGEYTYFSDKSDGVYYFYNDPWHPLEPGPTLLISVKKNGIINRVKCSDADDFLNLKLKE